MKTDAQHWIDTDKIRREDDRIKKLAEYQHDDDMRLDILIEYEDYFYHTREIRKL
jgi:hypothetical protein